MHVLGYCEASAQYSPINFFVNLFHSKNSNLPHCFSDLIHTEYRKLHKNNGHSPFALTFRFALNNAIVGRTVSQHPVSTTVRKSRDYHQCLWSKKKSFKLLVTGRLIQYGQRYDRESKGRPVTLLRAQWHFCLRQYFFNKKPFLVLYLF